MDPYREQRGFLCTANMLLELLNQLEGYAHKDFVSKRKKEIFILVDLVYGTNTSILSNVSHFYATVKALFLLSYRELRDVVCILNLGKENGLSRMEWLEAMGEGTQ